MAERITALLNSKIPPQCPFRYILSGKQPQIIKISCKGYPVDDVVHIWTVYFTLFGNYYLKNEENVISDGTINAHMDLEPLYSAIIDIDKYIEEHNTTDVKTIKIIALVKRFVCIPPLHPDIWAAISTEIRREAEQGEFVLCVPPQHIYEYGRQLHSTVLAAGFNYQEEIDGSAKIFWL